jgi:hypothetical protein
MQLRPITEATIPAKNLLSFIITTSSYYIYYNKTAAENKTAVDISTAVGEH